MIEYWRISILFSSASALDLPAGRTLKPMTIALAAMEGLLPTTKVEKPSGKAEVRAIFKIRGVIVAGSMCISGKILRGGHARLVRDGQNIWEGKVAALKRFKDDVKEVSEGFECGISLDGYSEMKEKDIIESFEIEEIKQRL